MEKKEKKPNIEAKVGGLVLKGKVVSSKMKDTAVVEVSRLIKHPKYQKYVEKHKRYKAHDVGNTHQVGETVSIQETRPISRDKHFKII